MVFWLSSLDVPIARSENFFALEGDRILVYIRIYLAQILENHNCQAHQ